MSEGRAVGFFTDPTVCIGCKACEVACKEWNNVPEDGLDWTGNSYDNSGAARRLHVAAREVPRAGPPVGPQVAGPIAGWHRNPFGWLFLSDVCKHCEHAGCLEACPTGAIFRTEVGSVYVQDDVCNGCGYCVVGCPFGVIDAAAPLPGAGGAFKCTFCYDRQIDGLTPACAKACPTESIQFGRSTSCSARAESASTISRRRGFADAHVYNPVDTSVGGIHAFFLAAGGPEDSACRRVQRCRQSICAGAWLSAALTRAGAGRACAGFALIEA